MRKAYMADSGNWAASLRLGAGVTVEGRAASATLRVLTNMVLEKIRVRMRVKCGPVHSIKTNQWQIAALDVPAYQNNELRSFFDECTLVFLSKGTVHCPHIPAVYCT